MGKVSLSTWSEEGFIVYLYHVKNSLRQNASVSQSSDSRDRLSSGSVVEAIWRVNRIHISSRDRVSIRELFKFRGPARYDANPKPNVWEKCFHKVGRA